MHFTRRTTLALGLGSAAGILLGTPSRAQEAATGGDVYPTDGGEIVIHPVEHASFVMETPAGVIYVDPVGGAETYSGLPAPDLILITHEHGDHYEPETLTALPGSAPLITNPAVHAMLPEDLRARATAIANGETTTAGDMTVEAVPAYNTTPERQQYHPEGRDNGYVLGIDGRRVYIAGDTEDTPEMRALEDIDIAFVPMNLPYTMTPEQAAAGVAAFAPAVVYPYHYNDSDLDAFERGLAEAGAETEVVRGDWYG